MFSTKIYRTSLIAIACLLVGLSSQTPAIAQTSALATVQQFVSQALDVMADKQAPVAQKQQQLRQLIEPRFDFREMSKQSLGPHWRGLSPEQQATFTQTFKAFIENAYLDKIGNYRGQKVNFLKQSSLGEGYQQVFTSIVQQGAQPIPVNYLMEQKDGQWKVYDVTVDNISIIANYRNQFNRIMNEQGYDKLIASLKSKEQQLSQPPGA
jgi:phospholipid transport system substrate-binding protein